MIRDTENEIVGYVASAENLQEAIQWMLKQIKENLKDGQLGWWGDMTINKDTQKTQTSLMYNHKECPGELFLYNRNRLSKIAKLLKHKILPQINESLKNCQDDILKIKLTIKTRRRWELERGEKKVEIEFSEEELPIKKFEC